MRKHRRIPRRSAILAALLALVGVTGCPDFNVLSTQEEIAIGQQVAAKVEEKEKVYANPAVQAYVSRVTQRITRVADRQDVPYQIKVLEDHKQINAFAGPGGFMYVYTGLLRLASSEAELASVLAHETGHVVAKHSAKALSNMLLVEQLSGLVLGSEPHIAGQLAGQLVAGAGMAQMSRGAEHEADRYAVAYLKRAGYDPRALLTFFEKMNSMKKQQPSAISSLFASHPPTEDRVAHVRSLIAQVGPGGEWGADTYRRNLSSLFREAPPKDVGASEPPPVRTLPVPSSPRTSNLRPAGAAWSGTALSGSGPPRKEPPRDDEPKPPARTPRSPRPRRGPLMICRNLTKGNVVASQVVVANTAATRRRGLLGRHSLRPDEGMLLTPCRSIHTIGMKFAIDAVFLDKAMRVVEVRHNLKPGRMMVRSRKAHSTLELPAGIASARHIQEGDLLRVYNPASPALEKNQGR
jgi:Zn-dependent protease with chaperone function/uncharacterized membrane protein (UPF0127 family)